MSKVTRNRRTSYPTLALATDKTPRGFAAGLEPPEPPAAAPIAEPEPTAEPVRADAISWATAITGRLREHATAAQRDRAVDILNDDSGHFHGRRPAVPGPSLDELRAPAAAEPADEAETAAMIEGLEAITAAAAALPDPAPGTQPVGPCDRMPAPLPLADWVADQAHIYRRMDTDAAALVARALEQLEREIRFLSAASVADYDDRKAAADWARDQDMPGGLGFDDLDARWATGTGGRATLG